MQSSKQIEKVQSKFNPLYCSPPLSKNMKMCRSPQTAGACLVSLGGQKVAPQISKIRELENSFKKSLEKANTKESDANSDNEESNNSTITSTPKVNDGRAQSFTILKNLTSFQEKSDRNVSINNKNGEKSPGSPDVPTIEEPNTPLMEPESPFTPLSTQSENLSRDYVKIIGGSGMRSSDILKLSNNRHLQPKMSNNLSLQSLDNSGLMTKRRNMLKMKAEEKNSENTDVHSIVA